MGYILIIHVLDLLTGLHAHSDLGAVQAGEEGGGTVAEHDLGHGFPLASGLFIPAFLLGHTDCYPRGFQSLPVPVLCPCDAPVIIPGAIHDKAKRGEPAALVDRSDQEGGRERGLAVNDVKVLHDHQGGGADSRCKLQSDHRIRKVVFISVRDDRGLGYGRAYPLTELE